MRGAKIRPSLADRKVGQLRLHSRAYAEGVGWQDFLASHAMDTALVRRVRFYLTSRASSEDLPVIRPAAEREFRLLQGIHHPGHRPRPHQPWSNVRPPWQRGTGTPSTAWRRRSRRC